MLIVSLGFLMTMMKPPKNSSIRSTEINTQSYNQKNKNGDHKTAKLSHANRKGPQRGDQFMFYLWIATVL